MKLQEQVVMDELPQLQVNIIKVHLSWIFLASLFHAPAYPFTSCH
jgi:hypothetical protein